MIESVGKHTYGHQNINIIHDISKLKIGSFCSFGGNIQIFLGGNHRVDWATTFPFGHIHQEVFNKFDGKGHPKTNGDVIIGNDVWIGNNTTIMSGIKIGDGAVIGANSHVLENVKPYAVVGGNPAKFYYYRFNQETIKRLLQLKWWDLDDSIINEIVPYLCSSDIDKLFEICISMNLLSPKEDIE